MFTKTKIKVIAPHSAHHYIFVPKSIAEYPEKILQMLDMHCGEVGGIMTENKGEGSYISHDFKTACLVTRVLGVGGELSLSGTSCRLER